MASTPVPLRWPAEAIWEAVAPALPGFTVEILPEIDSTNSELMRRFRAASLHDAPPEPVLLVAEQQTAGRGRMGRHWQSQRGESLTFSLGLALQPADWSGLSLVVGISLAESLDAGGSALQLKWPNDLWLHGRKLGGILVETANAGAVRYAVIGVGLNVAMPAEAGPNEVTATAAGPAPAPAALQELEGDLDAPAVLKQVVAPLLQAIKAFELFGFAPFRSRFAARDALAGRLVRLSDGTQGTAHGVAENGALLVHTPAGMKEITSAEVSVRPVEGAAAAARPANPETPC